MTTENGQAQIEDSQQRHSRHQGMEAMQVLDIIEKNFADNPRQMQYFYDLLRDVYCNGVKPHSDKAMVGSTCVQVPDEIIHAAGGVPVRLCNGFYTNEEVGGEFMPSKSCALVKATLGMLKSETNPYSDGIDTIVSPTSCDQKKKAGLAMREMGYEVYDLELPPVKDSEIGREYWRRSVRSFTKEIGRITGQKVTRKGLKQAIAKVGRAQHAYHRLNELRKLTPLPFLGKDMFVVTNTFFFDDVERWTDATEKLADEIEQRARDKYNVAGRRSPRIVFTGSPPVFPNLKLPLMIEQSDAVIVADETCSANRLLNDMVSVDEWFMYDMVDAVADRYLKACTCPIFSANDDRIRRLVELVRAFNADGVVYQAFAGCSVYEMEQRSVAKALEKEGIPMLYVETDYSPSQGGQLSTRVEAFVESLKARRRRR